MHPECGRRRTVRSLRDRFERFLRGDEGAATYPPRWPWARLDNREFRKRVHARILEAVEAWAPDKGSLMLCANTGAGKTAVALARLYRLLDESVERVRDAATLKEAEKIEGVPSIAWITGPELSGCRRRWSIGEEARLVDLACARKILVLDELGFEPDCEEIFAVLDHRYRAVLPTIVTTGLTRDAFRAHYGDALFRRLIEPGKVLEVT